MKLILCATLGLAAVACSSPPEPRFELGAAPSSFLGFPALSQEDMVVAQASFQPDHARTFEEDLVRAAGVIPVRLDVRLRGEGAEDRSILLNPDQWELALYLQDGTALRQINAEELAESLPKKPAQKVRDNRFITGPLNKEPTTGFVFFLLDPKDDFEVDGRSVVHTQGKTRNGLDLYQSLVSFRVTIDDVFYPFYVGIKPQ